MIHWNWNKVNFYNSALKPLPRLPYRSKQLSLWDILIFATFGTSRSTRKCHVFHLWLSQIEGNWWEKTTRHPFQPPIHPPTPPKHLWTLQNTLRDPKHIPLSARNSLDFYKALVRQSDTDWEAFELSRYAWRDSVRYEGVRRCLLSVSNVCECLRLSLAISRICQGCDGSVWDICGCLEGVEGWRGPEGGVWLHFSFSFLQFCEVTNEILDIFR